MKRSSFVLLATLIFSVACLRAEIPGPAEFTKLYAESLRAAMPGAKVEVVKDLELNITSADGRKFSSFLNNAYDDLKLNPKNQEGIIKKFVASGVEAFTDKPTLLDRTHIIPVIKDRPWLAEMHKTLIAQGATKPPDNVVEDFSPDLIIVYAEDSPKSIRYLTQNSLKEAKVERSELRALACSNLMKLLPKIRQRGGDGTYMITAGGNYEASLLLIDSIWSGGQIKVQGDIVVSIPTRDLLFVTGSEDAAGLEKVKKAAAHATETGTYRLTQKLFVYRKGRFEEFK